MSLSTILGPIEFVVSWIMVAFHSLFGPIFGEASGAAWALSIVGLVVVIRIVLIPLFVKQINSQRGLQLLQPEIKKIQAKYKNDRERQSQELMKLYKETGTNPLASCLPILAQAPIFFALFRVLNGIAGGNTPPGFPSDLVEPARDATIFGAAISETFLNAEGVAARIVTLTLILLMSGSTFITQKQLMTKNMPASAMDSPFAQQQKILLYVFPLIFAITGVNFPIGVLLYWLTTNVWSMGQQFYVIHRMPAPGSLAAENLERRQAEKAKRKAADGGQSSPGAVADGGSSAVTAQDAAAGSAARQRQQPKRKNRDKRKGGPRPPGAKGSGDEDDPAAAAS